MKKTILMLVALAAVFACALACFSPSSKVDKSSPLHGATNSPASPR